MNRMGFGVNGVMTNDPSMFCGRIEMTFPCMKMSVRDKGDGYCIYSVDCGKGFTMRYEWEQDSKRITKIYVLD